MSKESVRVFVLSALYACFLALNSFSLWGFTLLPQTAFGHDVAPFWSYALYISNALTFFVLAALCSHNLLRTFSFLLVCMAGSFICSLLSLLIYFLIGGEIFILIGGVSLGIATTCAFYFWVEIYARVGLDSTRAILVIGSILSAVPFLGFLSLQPTFILLMMGALSIVTCVSLGFCVYKTQNILPDGGALLSNELGDMRSATQRPNRLGFIVSKNWRSLLCVAVIGVMAPTISALSEVFMGEISLINQSILIHAENLVAAALVGGFWLLAPQKTTLVKMFNIVFPVMISLFLVLIFIPHIRLVTFMANGVVFVIFSLLVVTESISLSGNRESLGATYSLIAGTLYGANALGNIVISPAIKGFLANENMVVIVVVALLYLFSISMYFATRPVENDDKSTSIDISDIAKSSSISDSQSDVLPSRLSFESTINDLSHKFNLSERQSEVFALLAKGYTFPAIAQELYVSENTVRTHAKKLYLVFDVHSKQELVEMVQKHRG